MATVAPAMGAPLMSVTVPVLDPVIPYPNEESSKMDFSDVDRAPMHALNAFIWKSIKGADSPVPSPVHRFRPLIDPGEAFGDKD
jgi:hypothetical protein